MPGRLLRLTPLRATGWAIHPRLAAYRVVVHMARGAVILRSALAETPQPREQAQGAAGGFSLDLAPLDIHPADLGRLRFTIGETDERIDMPAGWPPREGEILTVEDILAEAHAPRAWISGATYLDAAAAGLRVATIIDLLYRDYLGRPSDARGLAHYTNEVRRGISGFDDIRRTFVDSEEYRLRRKHLDRAPGSIFSQAIVMAAAALDLGHRESSAATAQAVAASDLLPLDGRAFVTELYRRLLLKEPDDGGMAHYLHQLNQGVSKVTVIRTIAGELEAITAGVRVTDYPVEETESRADAL